MDFSGERFIPDKSAEKEIEVEHMQRYSSLHNVVKDKIVLDAACGEGYGAMSLAASAAKVIAIDISEETIKHARNKYSRDNLTFYRASIADIPLDDKSIDIVVSFETIEHVNSETQTSFMNEIKRVLKDEGILIISTPNKEIYSDLFSYSNPFHIKEFYKKEFSEFLRNHFKHVRFYFQKFEIVSLLYHKDETDLSIINNHDVDGKYIIALCCNVNLPLENFKSTLIVDNNRYIKQIRRIIEVQNEIENLSHWALAQDEEIKAKNKIIDNQNHRIEELSKWAISQDKEINEKNETIEFKNLEVEKLSSWGKAQEKEVNLYKNRIEELYINLQSQEEKITKVEEMRKIIEELLSSKKELTEELNVKKIECININLQYNENCNRINDLENEINKKDFHITSLLEKEKILYKIYASRGWKLLLSLYKIEEKLVPINSRRRSYFKYFYKTIKNFKNILVYINKETLMNFFRYLKKNGIKLTIKKIKLYIDNLVQYDTNPIKVYKNNLTCKLVFKKFKNPLVSIIIPVYNQWEYTFSCLQSIYENTDGIEYEIIIADDVSSDDTINIDKYVENVKTVRNKTNKGFLLNCKNATKYAKGKYIHFLNNDTNVQKDWLKTLLEAIKADPFIGLIGSKLVYENGRLQEAGGIIWNDASGWNYGRMDDPEKSEFNYIKEVDYISGASIMINADLWNKIGGFDDRYIPAYFEDADLAFEVRKLGYKVVYQPKSVIVHFEGISHGKSLDTGIKSYQVENKVKFLDKWTDILRKENFKNGEKVFYARDRSRNKKTILVIDHYVPHFDKDAGSKTTYQYLQLFVMMGLNVKFLGDNFFRHEPYTSALQQLGIEVFYGVWYRDNWKMWIKENAENIHYVYLNRPHISIKYIDFIKNNTNAKILYYGHDLHFLRETREYELLKDKEILKSVEHWKKIELNIISKADVAYFPSEIEVKEIMQLSLNNVKTIPAYIFEDFNIVPKNFDTKNDILFVGGFGHKPNIDGVIWFINNIFPLILMKLPSIKINIVGSNPPDSIVSLQNDRINITGFVTEEELVNYYNKCKIVVIPLRYGAGIKGKVIESMYHGVPMVTTTIGAEGLSGADNSLIVADTENLFAESVINIYNNNKFLEELSMNAMLYVKNNFSIENALKVIGDDIVP